MRQPARLERTEQDRATAARFVDSSRQITAAERLAWFGEYSLTQGPQSRDFDAGRFDTDGFGRFYPKAGQ